jgi:hypothetical protein
MSVRLSSAEYALLGELEAGPRAISESRPRDVGDRLVAARYATSRNLDRRSVAYEITRLGLIALVLSQYGILNTQYTVQPYRHDVDGRWYLIVNSEGNPSLLMSLGTAATLLDHLRAIGIDDLADDLQCKIEKARRYAAKGQMFASQK